MTIWEAVRASRNLPVVRVLEATGVDPVLDLVRAAGIDGRLHPYPSLALGAGECTLQAMVRGYSTLANGGRLAPPPFLVRRVVDRDGKVLESHDAGPGEQVLEPMATCQLVQCLQGAAERGTAARCAELGWPLAGKTGTTNDHADAWFVGFSTRIACGVWVGLDERRTLYPGANGTKVALPIWVDFMRTALAGTPREPFPVPAGMEWAEVDRYTGLLAGPATPGGDRVRLAFKAGTVPTGISTPEAEADARQARAKAAGLAPEVRVWSARVPAHGSGQASKTE
jgi:penicillin-binding protein 1A